MLTLYCVNTIYSDNTLFSVWYYQDVENENEVNFFKFQSTGLLLILESIKNYMTNNNNKKDITPAWVQTWLRRT